MFCAYLVVVVESTNLARPPAMLYNFFQMLKVTIMMLLFPSRTKMPLTLLLAPAKPVATTS